MTMEKNDQTDYRLKKMELENLKRDYLKLKRRNIIKKNAILALQVATLAFGSAKINENLQSPTKEIYQAKVATINEEGINFQETNWVESEAQLPSSFLKYVGKWEELPTDQDYVYRTVINTKDTESVKQFLDAYIIWDPETMLDCIDAELEIAPKSEVLDELNSEEHIDLSYQYIETGTKKEVPFGILFTAFDIFMALSSSIAACYLIGKTGSYLIDEREYKLPRKIRKLQDEISK